MNRRELLKRVASVVSASGVPVTVSAFELSTPPPLLAVIETPHCISSAAAARIADAWALATSGTPFEGVKVAVLSEGLTLTMLGPDGAPLTRLVVAD